MSKTHRFFALAALVPRWQRWRGFVVVAGIALLMSASFVSSARANFIFTLQDTVNGLLITGNGTINTSGLTFVNNATKDSAYAASIALLQIGPNGSSVTTFRGASGPASLGPGGGAGGFTGTGDFVLLRGQFGLIGVPMNYVSGSLLSNSALIPGGFTISNQGFNPGNYVYTWGSGVNADSLTVNIVSGPSGPLTVPDGGATLGLLALAFGGLVAFHPKRARA